MSFFGRPPSRESSPFPGEEKLKIIRYRGGVVTFRIPSHWREDYTPDGGADFYEDAPDSPTFRLAVITMRASFPVTSESSSEILQGLRQASFGIQRLPSGLALIRFIQRTEDRGHRLLITYWLVASPLPPSHARIANFSLTVLEHQQNDPKVQETLRTLDAEIRSVSFAPELGISPSSS
jgi:hypothetical protein